MVIVKPDGGIGNQVNLYALGKYLAHKLNTELKLDISGFTTGFKDSPEFIQRYHSHYRLSDFNIVENFATPEEIKRVNETGTTPTSAQDLENIQGDVFIRGARWVHDAKLYELYGDIADVLRKEFTLKKPLSPTADMYYKKILSAENSVSLHFRFGDYVYRPNRWFPVLPFDYHRTCIDILKYRYGTPPPTAFVFAESNMSWIKENLHLDTPTEFVEGCETDNEEFFLMRLCKHNITIPSTFSKRAAWLNSNPDKKIFTDVRSDAKGVQQFHDSLTPAKKDALLDTKGLIGVPYDYYNQPEIPLQPIFSLLLVVNNDAANLPATLDSFLNQDYKYYEVIIIDNATTDGSDKICRQAIEGKINVTYKRLRKKIGNAAAWNRALKSAQGKYILFLKVGDRFFRTEPKKNLPFLKYGKHFLNDSLSWLYFANEMVQADIVHLCSWLEENTGGEVAFAGKKFSAQRDDEFQQTKQMSKDGSDAAQLLLNRQINSFLGTKLYYREFLKEHGIKFDEQLDDRTAELAFQAEAFLKTKYLMYLANALYVAPLQKSKQYSTARIDIQLVPKGEGDFQIVSVSDDKADVLKPGWFQKGGIGYMLQSYAGKLDIATKSTVDGRILLRLRGLDVRTPEDKSKRIPYWVDYTKLTVNGKVIFDKLTPAWHDKPYRYDLDVKAGEEIKIHAEWLLHYMGN